MVFNYLVIFVFILCMLLGIYFVKIGLRIIIDARSTRRWPWTEGKIVDAGIKESDMVAMTSRNTPKDQKWYTPKVHYVYEAHGRQMKSDSVSLSGGMSYGSERSARRFLKKYPVGSTHRVYYSPEDATRSTLELGLRPVHTIWLLGGIMAILMSVFAIWLQCWKTR